MKKALFFLMIFCATHLQAQENRTLRTELDSIINNYPLMQQASLGIMVYDATAETLLYNMDEKKLHRPASTTKTFTCATALKNLGPDYGIRTSIYGTGKIHSHHIDGQRKNVLEGDLWVKGNFDPAFSSADLDTLLMGLQAHHIDSIAGNIYADMTMKNRTLAGYGWCWDDTGDDSPLLSPLVLDKDTCFMTKLTMGLENLGIGIRGTVGDSILPHDAQLLAEKCRTLQEILPHCLKTSDNRYAESILYQLGNLNDTNYDKTEMCISFVNQLIESLGFSEQEYRLVDGSGLSFYNMITPEVEVALMNYIYKETDFFEIFKEALPISGVDGTLKNRMKGSKAEGRVYAKTGSLTGTYALTGYLFREDGHVLLFSMMNDGVPAGKGTEIRNLQDAILVRLAE